MKLKSTFAGLALTSALTIGGAMPSFAQDPANILFLIWSEPSNSFFEPVINGAKAAAEQQGVTIDVQFGNEDPTTETNILETAIANKVDAIAITVADDNAYDDLVCKAMAEGIPVVTFNIDDSQGAAGSCRMAFMGQNFVSAGYALGQRMIAEHGIKSGDLVFTPVENPEGTYAVLRHQGVNQAMAEVGATTEILGVGNDHGQALTLMTQWLVGHPDADAVIGLGQTPTSQSAQAIADAGMKIPAGGFDVSASIIDDLEAGRLTAAVDQQPYSQGYYAITQLALNLKYGLYPSDMATGGQGLVDKTNFGKAREFAGVAR